MGHWQCVADSRHSALCSLLASCPRGCGCAAAASLPASCWACSQDALPPAPRNILPLRRERVPQLLVGDGYHPGLMLARRSIAVRCARAQAGIGHICKGESGTYLGISTTKSRHDSVASGRPQRDTHIQFTSTNHARVQQQAARRTCAMYSIPLKIDTRAGRGIWTRVRHADLLYVRFKGRWRALVRGICDSMPLTAGRAR